MKFFYITLLLVGCFMTVVMQGITIALPPDAVVASVLSKAPSEWSLSVSGALGERLSPYNIKAELIVALKERASFRNRVYSQNLWIGGGLLVLSVTGLLRERKIGSLSQSLERSGGLNKQRVNRESPQAN